KPGADLREGDLLVRAGAQLGPAELGLAAAVGMAELTVHRRPRVALMSTGSELVEVGAPSGAVRSLTPTGGPCWRRCEMREPTSTSRPSRLTGPTRCVIWSSRRWGTRMCS